MASDKRLDQVKLVNSAESVLVVNGDQVEKAALAGFANSMGSSVPLQQTTEQVSITGLYARTSDGKMVELTKESVASVMAGLVVSFPKHGAIDDANLDDIKTVGTYTVGDRCTNKPASETWNHSMLQVVVGRNDWVTQIYYSGAYGKIYIRHFKYNAISTGEWSSWSTINFGYNTLAELSSGVAEQNSIYNVNRTLNAGESYDTGKSFGLIVLSAPSSGLVGVYIAYAGNVLMVKGSDETSLNSVYEFSRTSSGTVNLKNKSDGQRLINLTIISAC